jgi:hypothetical protein
MTVPQDLSTLPISALLPNGSGGYTNIAGTGTSSGTFTIPGVPAGTYRLQVGNTYNQITTSNPNVGYYVGGRPNAASGEGVSAISVTASGFPSGLTEAFDSWWVPNLGMNNFDYSSSAYLYGGVLTDTIYLADLMDSSQGDAGYLIAGTVDPSFTIPYSLATAGYALGPDSITTAFASTTPVSGTVSAMASQATTVAVQRSAFAALRTTAAPGWGPSSCADDGLCGGATTSFNVQPLLYGDLYGNAFLNEPYVLQYSDSTGDATDINLGSISFGDFDPSEPLVFSASDSPSAWSTVSGGDLYQFGEVSVYSATPFASSSPATPVVGPVNSPIINGTSFFQSQTITSTTPTLTWSAPSVGPSSVSAYEVVVYEATLIPGNFWEPMGVTAFFGTLGTQVTIPPGVLSAGSNYLIFLYAENLPGADLLNEQFPPSLGYATALSSSGLITVASSATSKPAELIHHQALGPVPARILRDQARVRQQMQHAVHASIQKRQLTQTH